MICPKCQKTVSDDSSFCPECGYEFKVRNKSSNTKKIVMCVCVILLVCICGFFLNKQIQLNKVVREYKVLVDDGQYKNALNYYEHNDSNSAFVRKAERYSKRIYEKAVKNADNETKISLFNSGLLTEDYREEIEKEVVAELETIQTKYISKEISYEEVEKICTPFEKYDNSSIVSTARTVNSFCEKLKDSRVGFEVGIEAVEQEDYKVALENLSKVIEEDENYEDAQSKLKEVTALYKTKVMLEVEKNVASNNYTTAISDLRFLKTYCDDSDVSNKLDEVEKQEKAYKEEQENLKIEEYKNSQQVEVTSTKVYDDGYYIQLMKAEVKIKNNSNKVAKDVEFGLLLFDGNGYPVDVEYAIYQGTYENEFNCEFNSCNVTGGNTYGGNNYFSVSDNCRKAKACVRQVTYTDGTTWQNPYYEYWVKANHSSY